MPRRGLQVSPELTLPLAAVTQTFALLAVRRAGKSNAAAVMAEEMFAASQPFVVIDPKGDWWGLRASADGKGPGLPIPIFGGLRGDMPLSPESGRLMADLVFDHNLTCILDVSRFSKAARVRFLTAFAERLYELHQGDPQPRHIFLEEADRVLPQRVVQDMAACVGAYSDLIRLGGGFGLGVTLISQRSAVINKDGLTQVETMIAMRTTSPQDRKAIRDWMEHHAVAGEIVDSLPGLLSGEAWVSSSFFLAEHGQEPIQRIRFRRRSTFDSGATPEVGKPRRVATLADIDVPALGDRMAAMLEKAAQDDPKALRKRVAQLERELKGAGSGAGEAGRLAAENRELRAQLAEALARPPERIEVPVLAPGDVAALEQAITGMRDTAGSLELALGRAARTAPLPVKPVPPPSAQRVSAPQPAAAKDEPSLSKAQRAILTVLAQFPDGRTKKQLAMLSGYSANSGGFNGTLASLRTSELIGRGDPITIADAGRHALGEWEALPSGPDLAAYWIGRLSKAEGVILRLLLDSWPDPMSKEAIATEGGYSANSGGFNGALAKLRTLQLITGGSGAIYPDETLALATREAQDA
jgi:hypothetical protein